MGQVSKEEKSKEFARPKLPRKKKRTRTESENSTSDSKLNVLLDEREKGKKKRKSAYNPEEEARLEQLVFGDPADVIKNLEGETRAKAQDEPAIQVASAEEQKEADSENEGDDESVTMLKSDDASIITVDSKFSIKTPAWKDEDDEELSVTEALAEQRRKLPKNRPEKKYKELLKNKFQFIVGTPNWAKLDREKERGSDEESDEEILKHSNHIVKTKGKSLPKGTIDLKVLTDINKKTHVEGPFINTVQFHETSTVALVAGSSGAFSLFEVDGRENNKLHTMQFHRFPIHTARFLKEGTEVLVGSMSHAYCFSNDLLTGKSLRIPLPHGITNMKKFEISPDGKMIAICGRLGEVHLLSSNTKELIGSIKMNKKCRSLVFTPDSSQLIANGESSEVYTWDVASRTCVNRAFDDGCLSASALAISPNGQFVATGSKQGAVNIYETNSLTTQKVPVPVKTVLNLVTAITRLKFNPNNEILTMASDRKPNAFKMVHLPSFNVFSNFPTFQTKMFNPVDIDFSPASGFMSIGNNRGFAYLYRLKHYGNY